MDLEVPTGDPEDPDPRYPKEFKMDPMLKTICPAAQISLFRRGQAQPPGVPEDPK